MTDRNVVFEIARFDRTSDGERTLLERFQVLSEGAKLFRLGPRGDQTELDDDNAVSAIGSDADLHQVRADQDTRIITTEAVAHELPLVLAVPARVGLVDSLDGDDEDEGEWDEDVDEGEPVAAYRDRTITVNGHSWTAYSFDGGSVIPGDGDDPVSHLASLWAEVEIATGSSPFSGGSLWASIGLLTPAVVLTTWPDYEGTGPHVEVARRGDDARDVYEWMTRLGPPGWGVSTGADDDRICTQLFAEVAFNGQEGKWLSGGYLGAGVAEFTDSFSFGADWKLKLGLPHETISEILRIISADEDVADIATACREPDSPAALLRRVALREGVASYGTPTIGCQDVSGTEASSAADAHAAAVVAAFRRAHVPQLRAPSGYPGSIELALIDAVLSIRAAYGVTAETGVRGALERYKKWSGRERWDDLAALAALEPSVLADVLRNRQKTSGVLKADAIVEAAKRLVAAGVKNADSLAPNPREYRKAYVGVRGLGDITWEYLLMLLGYDGVKADTLVRRFMRRALDADLPAEQVAEAVKSAAAVLGVSAKDLDHSIWRYMSRPRRS